jgi:hypothetical protein
MRLKPLFQHEEIIENVPMGPILLQRRESIKHWQQNVSSLTEASVGGGNHYNNFWYGSIK